MRDKEYVIIKDPIHGYIKAYKHEKCIIDSPAFQRLRRLKQLPASHFIYPSALHSRFAHSLGVMHVAGEFADHLYGSLVKDPDEKFRIHAIARLIGLLHDIGHGPFSHTFEDHILVKYHTNHEILGSKIIKEDPDLSSCFDVIEKELGVTAEDMGKMIEAPSPETWPLTSQISDGVTERSLYYIIKGPYSADIIDYLLRDSYFTGAKYGIGLDWQRLAHNSKIIDDKIVLEYKAKDVLDHLLIARFFMFKTVYFHKTSRAFDKITGKLLEKADPVLNFKEVIEDIEKYIQLDDESILGHPEVRKIEEAKYILNRVVPYKLIYESLQPIEKNLDAFLKFSKRVVEHAVLDQLKTAGIDADEEAVFVDTPRLPTNPMFEETEVRLLMPNGKIEVKPVRETAVGLMPREIAFFRIYIHKKYANYENIVRSYVTSVFEGKELRSFY